MEPWKQELYHHGILGMKWGKKNGPPYPLSPEDHSSSEKKAGWRKSLNKRYSSTSISAKIARRKNEKIDKSFQKWKEGAANREQAIELGKTANRLKMEARNDPSKKKEAKLANKAYKKAVSKNTTYRKGQVKQEVGQDLSRKYLSEAKKVKKQLDKDPLNKELRKTYNDLMSKHDIERAKARRAADVGAKRSAKKAAIKRSATITIKAIATTAAVGLGVAAVNSYLNSNNVMLDGKAVRLTMGNLNQMSDVIKSGKEFLSYFYL